ncbi:MAG: hypothetical protein A2Z83_04390 [Omnitrophica bacterium GWA2_52_8]|nr:MAG: hypothetical protein A2Z83_04390 [Omnitrophica bacterium GWA2_52_8]
MRLSRFVPGLKWFEYISIRFAAGTLNLLPVESATWVARRVGDLLYFLMRKRRQTAFENISIAYGDSLSQSQKKRLVRVSFQNVSVSLVEFFRIPRMLAESKSRFAFEGTEHLDRAFADGKGVILVISHLGSWEFLAFLPYLRGYPCSVVVRAVRNPHLYRYVQRLRRMTHLNPIDRKNSVREVLHQLRQNRLVAILIDQWAGPEGVWTEFFGEPTSTTAIPARLARRTGASMVPAYCLRERYGKYKIIIEPAVPLDTDSSGQEIQTTLRLNKNLETMILRFSDQWIWTHRRWKGLSRYGVVKTQC